MTPDDMVHSLGGTVILVILYFLRQAHTDFKDHVREYDTYVKDANVWREVQSTRVAKVETSQESFDEGITRIDKKLDKLDDRITALYHIVRFVVGVRDPPIEEGK